MFLSPQRLPDSEQIPGWWTLLLEFQTQTELVVFINDSHTITSRYYLQCHVCRLHRRLPGAVCLLVRFYEQCWSWSDLFIHVNPILNGWLQSFLFTVLNEELLLLSKQPVFFISHHPRTETQSEGNLISMRMLALCKPTVKYNAVLEVFLFHFTLLFFCSYYSSLSIQRQTLWMFLFFGSALRQTFFSLITHKCMLTTAQQSIHENAFCRPVPSCSMGTKDRLWWSF